MSNNQKKPEPTTDGARKWKYTLITTAIFLLIANPYTYILVNNIFTGLFGTMGKMSSAAGCPTLLGFILHAIVFTLILRGVMEMNI